MTRLAANQRTMAPPRIQSVPRNAFAKHASAATPTMTVRIVSAGRRAVTLA